MGEEFMNRRGGDFSQPIELFLKVKSDYGKQNPDELKQQIPNEADCWFQKLPEKNIRDPLENVYRLLIKIDDERMWELKCIHNKRNMGGVVLYWYFVSSLRKLNFKPPNKHSLHKKCSVKISKKDLQATNDDSLYEELKELEVSSVEANRERDKEVWLKYVKALELIVREKYVRWKVKNIEYIKPIPSAKKDNGEAENGTIRVAIDKTWLQGELKREIEDFFLKPEIEDGKAQIEVDDERIVIEFNAIRTIPDVEKLNILANKHSYELVEGPKFRSQVAIKFKHDVEAQKLFKQIEQAIKSEYHLKVEVDDDGHFSIEEENIGYLKKVVSDEFGSLVEIKKTPTRLKVSFDNHLKMKFVQEMHEIIQKELNFDRAKISPQGDLIVVEVDTFLKPDFFKKIGFSQVKRTARYGHKDGKPATKQVKGVRIEGNWYCIDNVNGKQNDEIIKEIEKTVGNDTIERKPTLYFFKCDNKKERVKGICRAFKKETDSKKNNKFDIGTSELEVYANTQNEYSEILKGIKGKWPNAEIEDKKAISEDYDLIPKSSADLQRTQIIDDVLDEVRNKEIPVCLDKGHTNVICESDSKEICDEKFYMALLEACSKHAEELDVDASNPLRYTRYEFKKSEKLKKENGKKLRNNLLNEDFVLQGAVEKQIQDEEEDSQNDKAGEQEAYDEEMKPFTLGTLKSIKETELEIELEIEPADKFNESEFCKRTTPSKEKSASNENGETNSDEKQSSENLSGNKQANKTPLLYVEPSFGAELENIRRMQEAMDKLTKPSKKWQLVNENLYDFIFDASEAGGLSCNLEAMKTKILANLNEPKLKNQPRQIEAVAKSLATENLSIIQGPPGTGKTTVIAEIIWQALLQNSDAKILISSQTHLAVDNALERLKAKRLVRPLRIGNPDRFEDFGKAYSSERIDKWATAMPNSDIERENSNNAVANWVKNIAQNAKARNDESSGTKKVADEWMLYLQTLVVDDKRKFVQAYKRFVNVFAATCSESASRNFEREYRNFFRITKDKKGKEISFDFVIMDETSKATPPELAMPLTLGKKLVLIGDHKQLPPMIDDEEFSEALKKVGANKLAEELEKDYNKTSQFEKLFKSADSEIKTSLDTQFRMHEQIMNCVSQFYKDQDELPNGLKCGIEKEEMDSDDFSLKASRYHGLTNGLLITPDIHAIWVDVKGTESRSGTSTSWKNEQEIEAIKKVIGLLVNAEGFEKYKEQWRSQNEEAEIGVITFYKAQMKEIQKALYPDLKKRKGGWKNFEKYKLENEFGIPFRINTVDRFQGMERNIIIVSTVRSNIQDDNGKTKSNNKSLGFAEEPPRINVAFSRAKRLLIVIGNEHHFSQREEYATAIKIMHKIDITQL